MRKLLLLFFILTLTGCVDSPRKAEIAELEDGNFQISAISEEHWSGDFLSAELLKKAEEFCQKQNKQFKRQSLTKEDERTFNYANSSLIFKCKP